MKYIRVFFVFLVRILIRIRSVFFVYWYKSYYGVSIGENVRIYSKIKITGFGKINIGDNVVFGSKTIIGTSNKNALVKIGSNSFVNGSIIYSAKQILIGENCILSDCELMDTSSHGIPPNRRNDSAFVKIDSITVEDNVWIGSKVIVLPGVSIGENSIIGVNSVVSKNIPQDVFAAGIPAKVIKQIKND